MVYGVCVWCVCVCVVLCVSVCVCYITLQIKLVRLGKNLEHMFYKLSDS